MSLISVGLAWLSPASQFSQIIVLLADWNTLVTILGISASVDKFNDVLFTHVRTIILFWCVLISPTIYFNVILLHLDLGLVYLLMKQLFMFSNNRLIKSFVDEILESEEEYVKNLALLIDNTIEEDPDFYLIPENIFRNTEKICSFHSKKLLPALKSASNDLTALGDVFIENVRDILFYMLNDKNMYITLFVHNKA